METNRSSIRYSGRGAMNGAFNFSFISMTILGLSLMFVGFYQFNIKADIIRIDNISFFWCNSLFTILLLLYAFFAIGSKLVTEGVLYLLAAMSSLLMTVSCFYQDHDIGFLMLFFLGGFFGCAIIFKSKKERTLMLASFALVVYSLLINLLPSNMYYILGLALCVCGVGLVIVGCSAIAGIESGFVNLTSQPTTVVDDEDYPQVFEDSVGSILLAIMTFLYVYAVFYNYNVSPAYYMFTTVVSLITLVAAIYGIYHGVYGNTILMFLLALSKLIFTLFGYLKLGSTTHIDLMFVVIFVPLIFSFYIKGEKVAALLTLATSITTVAQTFTGYFFIVELSMAIADIVAIYLAVDTWYRVETGIRLKDTEFVRKIGERWGHAKG